MLPINKNRSNYKQYSSRKWNLVPINRINTRFLFLFPPRFLKQQFPFHKHSKNKTKPTPITTTRTLRPSNHRHQSRLPQPLLHPNPSNRNRPTNKNLELHPSKKSYTTPILTKNTKFPRPKNIQYKTIPIKQRKPNSKRPNPNNNKPRTKTKHPPKIHPKFLNKKPQHPLQ